MKVYVNGDSNSVGSDIYFHQSWPYRLCESLSAELICEAKGGASNDYILRTTNAYLDDNKPDLVIIGWTSWEREEWQHEGKFYNVNASGKDAVPPQLKNTYIEWVSMQSDEERKRKSKIYHERIYRLHQRLTDLSIKHLFFNALMPFLHDALWDESARVDWSNNYFGPYENEKSYYWFLKGQGFEPSQHNHYREDAQWRWAQALMEHDIIRQR